MDLVLQELNNNFIHKNKKIHININKTVDKSVDKLIDSGKLKTSKKWHSCFLLVFQMLHGDINYKLNFKS